MLETGARISAVREERRQGRLDRDLKTAPPPRAGALVTLGQIIRKSPNPRIIYELRSRLDVVFAGGRLTTSDAGFRGPDVRAPKPPDVFRIVGIGDSYMFGQGVSDQETYLSSLGSLLRGAAAHPIIETLNLAVPGFNTVMEVELLKQRVAEFEPDMILIEIVGNDLDVPNFLWRPVDPWTFRKSFLFDFVRSRVDRRAAGDLMGADLDDAPRSPGSPAATFSRAGDVPAAYTSMVGLPAFEGAVAELADLGRTRGVPVLALTHGVWFEAKMTRALAKAGITVLILRSALRQKARSLGAPDYPRSPLALGPADLHPSVLGHRVIAEELSRWLADEHRDALALARKR